MKEIRITEIRADTSAEGGSLILAGRPIVYDQPTTIRDLAGDYKEIIRAGALDEADLSDVRLLFNHDNNRVPLARTPKTMQLRTSSAGLEMVANLPDTAEAKGIYEAVKRGDLSGMSFAFTVPAGGDSYDAKTNTRTIHKIAKVYECSVVPYPAYPQTSIEARTIQQEIQQDYRARQNAKILCNRILAKSI